MPWNRRVPPARACLRCRATRTTPRARRPLACGLTVLLLAATAGRAAALTSTVPDATRRAVLTAVLQGTQSVRLPASAQSATYRFDPAVDTFVRSAHPGPTVLRSPSTIAAGAWSARMALSYFHLDSQVWPTSYDLVRGGDPQSKETFRSRFGALFEADVTLWEIAASYGVTDDLELTIDVPVSIVDLDARFRWLYDQSDPDVVFGGTPAELERRSGPNCGDECLRETTRTPRGAADQLGDPQFDNGTQAGLGQVAIGGKYRLAPTDAWSLAPSFELLLPSPNESQFAGPGDVGMTARVLSSLVIAERALALVDAGYTYQVGFQELTGFVWDAGVSVNPLATMSLDLGAGGTVFSRGIEPTPQGLTADENAVLYHAVAPTELGTNAVNFLFGVKVLVTDSIAVSGSAVVPVTDAGIRPDAAGALALEAYF